MNMDQLVGKHILTGLTWTDARGKLLRRTEYHGIIVSAGQRRRLLQTGGG